MRTILILLLFPIIGISQNEKNPCATLNQINKLIQEKHYCPKPIDDSLSVYVFEAFLDELDSNNSLFLKSEINELKKYKFKIDNFINEQNCSFLDVFFKTYNDAITRNLKLLKSIDKENFEYSSTQTLSFFNKKPPYKNTSNELKQLYKKRILFEILSNSAQISLNKDSIIKNFKTIANDSKTKVFRNINCNSQTKTLTKEKFNSIFINTFCSYFDPHTNYFSSSEKSDFMSKLSSSNYTFGIEILINKKNELSVSEITPYGSAYYSKKIELGDLLQKIKIEEKEFNLNCNNYEEICSILNSNDTKKATFFLRKKSGEIYTVSLNKQLMRDDQNSVYSYVLEYENQQTGYIKIPSFYSKFESGKTNVSDDVKKEILKLKDSNISKLIIDLENNGGGSMQEAISLCGLFITAPAVGQEKHSNNVQFIIGNPSSKPIFTGSIIVLINGYSASASEFFTNAMQDYNMAIVVGTKSFGKATMQEIFEIENSEKEYLKLTTGAFYRVTGKSHQCTGIIPTVSIPTIFEDQMHGEKSEKRALKNEMIRGYVQSNSYPLNENIKKIILQYNLLSKTNPTNLKIIQLKKRLNKLMSDNLPPILLNINAVFDYTNTYDSLWKDIENFNKLEYKIKIFANIYESDKTKKQDLLNETDKIDIKNLKSNFTINEALKIINNCK